MIDAEQINCEKDVITGYCRVKNISNQRFGMLTAIKFAYVKNSKAYWEFLCDCGCSAIKQSNSVIYKTIDGATPNCGCMTEKFRRNNSPMLRHGMTGHPAHSGWSAMKHRCTNKKNIKWHLYGGKGISICDRWMESFENFWEDMGATWSPGLTLDRIDGNGNYEPSNCRWATKQQQARNTSAARMVMTEFGEMQLCVAAEIAGISGDAICGRIKRGWSVQELLTSSRRK